MQCFNFKLNVTIFILNLINAAALVPEIVSQIIQKKQLTDIAV